MDELEIIIESDVVPRGTFDVRSLDAAPEARAPKVRPSSRGPVVALGEKTTFAESAVVTGGLDSANLRSSSDDVEAIAAVDRAASAPLPPRPAAADDTATGAPVDEQETSAEFFDTDLDSPVASFVALVKLVVYVAAMLVVLFAIYLWLNNRRVETVAEDGPTPPTELAMDGPSPPEDPADVAPDDPPVEEGPGVPVKADPPEADPPEADPPEVPDDVVDPDPDPRLAADAAAAADRLALDALRVLVSESETGGSVGVEEDAPGLLAEVESLRADAIRALKAGDYDSARAALQALLEKSPRDADATFRLGLVGHHQGDYEAAEASYVRATELSPNDPRPLNNLALIALHNNDRAAALQHLTAARQRAPRDPDVLTNLARISEDPEQALALYAAALDARPQHGPARLGRAQLRVERGDLPGAHADLQSLLADDAPYRGQALDALGVLARRQGDLEGAEQLHREAAQARPPAPEARTNLALVLLDKGDAKRAAKLLEAEVERRPNSARSWLALGIARTQLAEESPPLLYEAKAAYERALELDEGNWAVHHNYALCAERFGNYLFAMQQYERAIELDPDQGAPYANLARLLQRGGKPDKALSLLEIGSNQVPDDYEIAYQRAYLLAQAGRNIEARDSLRRFIELAPADDPRLPEANRGLSGNGG